MAGGSGIPQLKGELIGEIEENWWKTILAKILGGCLCIGAGLALGREGPSIQIGAMAGKGMAQLAGRKKREEKYLMTCGAGAGLACAFGAPLAGTVFVLEELLSTFSIEILLSTWMASMIADFVANVIFGLKPVFALRIEEALPLRYYWMVLVLGILLGVLGVAYNKVTAWMQDLYAKIPNKYVRLALPFLLVVPLALYYPMALGSGHYLVDQAASGMFTVQALLILLAVRFLFSIFSFASGAPGGIFLPLLVLGAVGAGAYATVMTEYCGLMSIYIGTFVMMGMTGLFSAIVRSPITGIILITEMGGDYANFLPLSIVAFTAYVVADLLHGRPVYDQLLDRMLSGNRSVK
jgi:H+/Cl- antiporter ClcA